MRHVVNAFYPWIIPGCLIVHEDYLAFKIRWIKAFTEDFYNYFDMFSRDGDVRSDFAWRRLGTWTHAMWTHFLSFQTLKSRLYREKQSLVPERLQGTIRLLARKIPR